MTNNEAILILIKMMPQPQRGDGKSTTHVMITEALTMAIQALNQESVLDKIRAEIEEERDSWDKWEEADYYYSYNKCLEIIDKYKVESEGKK